MTLQELEPSPQEGIGVSVEMIESPDVNFEPQSGWNPYPDHEARFTKFWSVEPVTVFKRERKRVPPLPTRRPSYQDRMRVTTGRS